MVLKRLWSSFHRLWFFKVHRCFLRFIPIKLQPQCLGCDSVTSRLASHGGSGVGKGKKKKMTV